MDLGKVDEVRLELGDRDPRTGRLSRTYPLGPAHGYSLRTLGTGLFQFTGLNTDLTLTPWNS